MIELKPEGLEKLKTAENLFRETKKRVHIKSQYYQGFCDGIIAAVALLTRVDPEYLYDE